MALPTNNSRPAIPYNPAQVLPNHNRYSALGKFPPTAQQLDGDFNAVVDLVNTLAGAINDTAAGIFPGAENELNANKLPTTDGRGNVSWTHVTPLHVTDNAIYARHIVDAAITPDKIQAQAVGTGHLADKAVTAAKILDNAVTTPKIIDNAITTQKMVDGCVTGPKLADGAVTATKVSAGAITTEKLADNAVTTPKIVDAAITTPKVADNAITTEKVVDGAITPLKVSSPKAKAGDVLTADGAGAASFLANRGRVLQIVSYEDRAYLKAQYDAAATPQTPQSFKTAPFLLRITPLKTNSKILLFYSINVGTGANNYACVVLCKDNAPFKVGTDAPSYKGMTHSTYNHEYGTQNISSGDYGCFNFSSLVVDTGVEGTPITYEIKKANTHTTLNSGYYGGGYGSVSSMHAVEVDI